MEKKCMICPRNCSVNRPLSRNSKEGSFGICRSGRLPAAARAGIHMWEEPCISGTNGSGTVFFSGCSLQCVYCQNKKISAEGFGKEISIDRLREIFNELIKKGVHNINLVNPTHYAESIREALTPPLSAAVVYNSSGYDSVDTLKTLKGKIDIYLPDMKYSDSYTAKRYSNATDYPEVAKKAILEMFSQTGPYKIDENDIMQSGVIIRHLVLPNNIDNSMGVIDWVKNTFKKGDVLFSLLSQYTPCGNLENYPEINRPLTLREYEKIKNYLVDSGIEDGFLQETDSSGEIYIPPFDLTGI